MLDQGTLLGGLLSRPVSSLLGGYRLGNDGGGATVLSQKHAPTDNGCANIAYANGRSSMFSTLKAPWHGLGVVISQAATSAEALDFANLAGWNLSKVQCFVNVNGVDVPCDRYGIVRGDTGAVLGTVGGRYEIVSNEQCFDFLDSVVGPGGARYETAGALGQGEQVWLLAKFPDSAEVARGDVLEKYIMFCTSHDGSMAVKCFPTTVRVVCQNTYRAALAGCRGGISMRHTNNIRENIKAAQEALGLASAACDEFADTARLLGQKPMSKPDDFFQQLLDKAVGGEVAGVKVTAEAINTGKLAEAIRALPPAKHWGAQDDLDRVRAKRREWLDDILARYESDRCNGNPAIAGTAWAAVNAVSEFADHSDKIRYKGSNRQRAENRMMSILDGRAQEITQAAVDLALRA